MTLEYLENFFTHKYLFLFSVQVFCLQACMCTMCWDAVEAR